MKVNKRVFIIMGVLFAYPILSAVCENNVASFSNVNMIQGDLFLLALSPPVENIQVYIRTAGGKGYSYLVLTNRSLGIPDLPGRASLIQLIPEGPSTNITVVFGSNTTVKILYGVLTNNYTYYRQVSTKYYAFSNGIFIVFPPQVEIPAGESRITFIINTFNIHRVESGFRIELPSLVTVIPVAAAIMFVIYLNAYIIVDSYYVSTKEELSRARKLGIAIILVSSAMVVYWLVGFIIKF
ncbi:MAG: hypothetical protein QXG12_06735 [Thermoproteota archaeon]